VVAVQVAFPARNHRLSLLFILPFPFRPQLFYRKGEKKSQKVLEVMKKALNLQQKSIKQHLITKN